MGTKTYTFNFEPDDRKRLSVETKSGKITKFLVQYETLTDDKWHPVVRYDTVHGYPHKDVLDRRGRVVEKVDLSYMTYQDALESADEDIENNWKLYKQKFFGRRIK